MDVLKNTSEEAKKRALRRGAVDSLRAPVSKEALLGAIHSVLEACADNNPSNEL